MNKKGFTLVELLVTIAISTLVLSIGATLVNNIIDNSNDKAVAIAHENIKKSANLYSKDFYDDIVWSNNKSCITVEQLIAKGYIKREEVKDATDEYIIIEKDEYNTIISETNINDSNAEGGICNIIINQKVPSPTSKDICADLEYTGEEQYLIKEPISSFYDIKVSDYSKKDADSYPVNIDLKEGYAWKIIVQVLKRYIVQ